ncbi:eukaryotic translation initiation factor 3 subunit F-like [Lytechinus pictus]|uniref:eukaryotic translation initiation factor 3 subunit F-like n=1 Tax=Lytechinus pictus TaxID=7653 RepID=UPI0030BA2148
MMAAFKMAASAKVVNIHPVVLFSIVDSFERRTDESARVIGTLLGTSIQGVVEVTNCFCVPHNESEDEVAVDMEFAKNMFELHKKVNSWENIVGWYATGREITGHSVLIHDYYSRECQNPIHVTVDTTMADLNMSVKTWVRQNMGVPDKSQGTVFIPIPKKIAFHQPEKVAMDAFIRETDPNRKTIELTTDLQYVSKASGNLQEMLTRVLQYVDDILTGKTSADNQIGRFLMNLVSNVPKLQPEEFDQMLNNSMKDLLMVVYLSGLIETQLTLNEKLTLSKAANSV